jgi:hypothetical protein
MGCEFIQYLGRANISGMYEIQIDRRTNNSRVLRLCSPYEIGGENEGRIVVEISRKAFLRQFDAIPLNTRKTDFERITIRSDCFDLNSFARRLRSCYDRLGREVEGNAQYVRIFNIETSFLVQFIGFS